MDYFSHFLEVTNILDSNFYAKIKQIPSQNHEVPGSQFGTMGADIRMFPLIRTIYTTIEVTAFRRFFLWSEWRVNEHAGFVVMVARNSAVNQWTGRCADRRTVARIGIANQATNCVLPICKSRYFPCSYI